MKERDRRNGRERERADDSDPRAEAEPLCSLIKPGVARLGGVCAVAGGVRVATVGGSGRKNGRRKRAGGQSQVAPRGCRWRLERVAWVGNGGEATDQAGWIERVRRREGGRARAKCRKSEKEIAGEG